MDAIIQPRRGRNSPRLGPVALLAATEPDVGLLRRALAFDAHSGRRLFISQLFTTSESHPALSLSGPMVGAPYAAMVAETLIAWGARTLVFLGWCGAVSKPAEIGDLILPTAAFIDEGTSRHYLPGADKSAPSACLSHQLAEACSPAEVTLHQGPVWTTDAPFRETREKVMEFQRRGALAVEMETSALFTVAAYRSVEAAALLLVSDDLSEYRWKAGFKDPGFTHSREAAAAIVGRLCSRLPVS